VRGVEGEVQEERPILTLVDKTQGLPAEQVGGVALLADPFVGAEERRHAVAFVGV